MPETQEAPTTTEIEDAQVRDYSTIVIISLLTENARDWAEANIGSDALWGNEITMERRYAFDIISGMFDADLNVVRA